MASCHQRKRLTWSQLLDAADRAAHGLAKLGIEPADRVGLWAMNCWEWLVVHMACARAGAILVNVNPSCRAHEMGFILRNSRMKALEKNAGSLVQTLETVRKKLRDLMGNSRSD